MSGVTDTFSGVSNIKLTGSMAQHLHECEERATALSPRPLPHHFLSLPQFSFHTAVSNLLLSKPQKNLHSKKKAAYTSYVEQGSIADQFLLFSIHKRITIKSTKNCKTIVVYL